MPHHDELEGNEGDLRVLMNTDVDRQGEYPSDLQGILSLERYRTVRDEIVSWPGYGATPLIALDSLAARLGISKLWYKDEGQRFTLQSFKALGGPFGVLQVLRQALRDRAGIDAVSGLDLIAGAHREVVSEVTVACATDGNHGRAVAWAANLFGCRCVVYLPSEASPGREDAIAAHGAEVVRVAGTYDEAVRRADVDARQYGMRVVSDHAYPGYEQIPRDVMQGYAISVDEVADELARVAESRGSGPCLTHVFTQAGVGGFAAAVLSYLWEMHGAERPVGIVVEPHGADCIYRSAEAGEPTPVPGTPHTMMACLCTGEVSTLAWPILRRAADAFITIPDADAVRTLRLIAQGVGQDPCLVAGESGVAGLAGLIRTADDVEARDALGLGRESRVLVFGTEGATDPDIYSSLVGS
jgi:diaminopropionate ammonia-lyase